MSSRSKFQQHLTSANMAMIERALARVRLLYEFDPRSAEEARIAAVMVAEFQRGNIEEDGLVAVFLGILDPASYGARRVQMRKSLESWENEGGAIIPRLRLAA